MYLKNVNKRDTSAEFWGPRYVFSVLFHEPKTREIMRKNILRAQNLADGPFVDVFEVRLLFYAPKRDGHGGLGPAVDPLHKNLYILGTYYDLRDPGSDHARHRT